MHFDSVYARPYSTHVRAHARRKLHATHSEGMEGRRGEGGRGESEAKGVREEREGGRTSL